MDDPQIVSGIIHVIRNGLRRRDAPAEDGSHKTPCNRRLVRWRRIGVFNRVFGGLACREGQPHSLMIDTTHLKARRTAASLLKSGLFPSCRTA